MDSTWKVYYDLCGSELFPVILKITQPIHDNNRPPCWKTNKADWQQFKNLCNRRLVKDPNSTILIKHFTEILIAIANETIPKTSPSNRRNTPRFNNEWKIAIGLRNVALHKLKKEPLIKNLNSFKLLRAKAMKQLNKLKRSVYKTMLINLIALPKKKTV